MTEGLVVVGWGIGGRDRRIVPKYRPIRFGRVVKRKNQFVCDSGSQGHVNIPMFCLKNLRKQHSPKKKINL